MKISCTIFLCAFLLLRPFAMQDTGSWYPADDRDYFAQASSLSFGEFPSYKKEYFTSLKEGPLGAVGPGILAAPFVFVFSLIDRAEGSDISEKRTEKNITGSWSQFGFMVSSVFYFCLGCALLYQVLSEMAGPLAALWAVVLMVICQGMPLFAFRRPIFSHMAEFTLQSIFIYLFLKNEMSSGKYIQRWWSYALLGIGAALIFLTRNNNILFAIVWPLLFMMRDFKKEKISVLMGRLFYVFIPFIVLVAVFQFWPEIYNNYVPYAHPFDFIKTQASWQDIFKRVVYVFTGGDWGLCYTAPFLLVGVLSLVFLKAPWKRRLVLACVPILVNFYIIVFFGSQGGWYGYRFLIASAFPLFVVPLAFLFHRLQHRGWERWRWGLMVLAVLPLMSMWGFEEKNTFLSIIPQSFGRSDYGHASYQLAVWQTLFDPKECLFAFYQGGVQYLCYLFYKVLIIFKWPMGLPHNDFLFQTEVLAFTLPFELKILIRVFLIYSLPFMMGWFFRDKAPVREIH